MAKITSKEISIDEFMKKGRRGRKSDKYADEKKVIEKAKAPIVFECSTPKQAQSLYAALFVARKNKQIPDSLIKRSTVPGEEKRVYVCPKSVADQYKPK